MVPSLFRWFERDATMLAYAEALRPVVTALEANLGAQHDYVGFCTCCGAPTRFRVNSGVMLGHVPNLREGLVCPNCGLSNRSRLMLTALLELLPRNPEVCLALLERWSPLYAQVARRYPQVSGSEFVARDVAPGTVNGAHGTPVRHESITRLSYATGALDCICHSDVLEHVFDTGAALSECRRVLRDGGYLLFTCPFLMHLPTSSARATENPDGTIVLHGPAEYHGDPVHAEGALTFHHFGWDLLAKCREAGFARVECGVLYDAYLGFTSSNHPDWQYGNMLPLLFRARA